MASKLERFKRLKVWRVFSIIISTISLIWAYVTVGFFTSFGVQTLKQTKSHTLGVIILIVAALYFVAITVTSIISMKHKNGKVAKKATKIAFKWAVRILKICCLVIAIYGLNAKALSDFMSGFKSVMSILWIVFTIMIDVTKFIIRKVGSIVFGKVKSKFTRKTVDVESTPVIKNEDEERNDNIVEII